jgi:NTE family protein
MSYGASWIFSKTRVGDWQVGYLRPGPDWPVARAVAASSCFPPVFGPLRLGLEPKMLRGGRAPAGRRRDEAIAKMGLTDGGVYDNMGLEPVWKTHQVVLVSDGGATFAFGPDAGLLWRLQRYTSIVSRQASSVRQRWLMAGYRRGELAGAYWGIGNSAADHDRDEGYSPALVHERVARVRTDLDAFSEAEQAILENHGYVLTDCAVRHYAPQLVPNNGEPFAIPNPAWLDEDKVRRALAHSNRQRLPFGRR